MKNWIKNKAVVIRNPNSTRPWQHVIEVITGYLMLAVKLKKRNIESVDKRLILAHKKKPILEQLIY